MKKWLSFLLLIIVTVALIANSTMIFSASNVVSQNGQLKVVGNKLCNSSGTPIQLIGMSSMGLQWYPFSANTVTNLVNDWKITVVRAAMYTAEKGYITDPTTMKNRVKVIVDAAIANGIYVIIDWHILSDGNPNTYKEQARAFFDEMSRTYGSYPNVIYEICNEPNGVDWATIKSYADYVIPTIRANDPDNIIVCGTDTWSQGVDAAANNPLSYNNVMYALHFYAGTHFQWLRDKANTAMSKGIAIFVTEWGTSNATGGSNGQVYLNEAQVWVDYMKTHQISWCNWSLCPKAESSAALVTGASMDGPWSDSQLTTSGKWVKSKILEAANNPTPTPVRVTPTPVQVTASPVVTMTPVRTATPRVTPTPSSPPGAGIKVQFYNQSTAATTNQLYLNFRVTNTGNSSIALSSVKMRYYYTVDGAKAQNFYCDWSSVGSSNFTSTFVTMANPTSDADTYVEIGFSSGAGNLAVGGSATIQGRVAKNDWSSFTQTNDYSFNSTATSFVDWTRVTGFVSGALAWGVEPGGSNPSTPTPVIVTPTPVRVTPTPVVVTPTPVRTATPVVATPTPVAGGYVVTYSMNDWGSGATVTVTIKNNTATAVNGWTLAWTFPGNQMITNLWSATYTQSGASVTVKDAGYNANIPANGGTVSFGFNMNYSGTNAIPAGFTLNGTACQIQ